MQAEGINALPEELLCMFFNLIRDVPTLMKASMTCRRWRQTVWGCMEEAPDLWEHTKHAPSLLACLQFLQKYALRLTRLAVWVNSGNMTKGVLAHIPATIRHLCLRGSDIRVEDFQFLPKDLPLKSLDLTGCAQLKNPDLTHWALKKLDCTPQGRGGVVFIKDGLKKLPRGLKKAFLSGIGELLTDEGLEHLPPNLKVLDISGYFSNDMKFTPKGISKLPRTLTTLNISYCIELTPKETFAALPSSLTKLNFGCPSSIKIKENLSELLPCLERLGLQKKRISAQALRNLPKTLKYLDLSETNIKNSMLSFIPDNVETVVLEKCDKIRHRPSLFDTHTLSDMNRRELKEQHWLCKLEYDPKKSNEELVNKLREYYERKGAVERLTLEGLKSFTCAEGLELEGPRKAYRDTINSSVALTGFTIGNFNVQTDNYHTRLNMKVSQDFPPVLRIEVPESVWKNPSPIEEKEERQPNFSFPRPTFPSEPKAVLAIYGGRFTKLTGMFASGLEIDQITRFEFLNEQQGRFEETKEDSFDFTNGEMERTRTIQLRIFDSGISSSISTFLHVCKKISDKLEAPESVETDKQGTKKRRTK